MSDLYAPPSATLQPESYGGVTGAMVDALRKTRPWVKLIAFALGFFGVVTALMAVLVVPGMLTGRGGPGASFAVGTMALYLFFAFIYLVLAWMLFRFARRITALEAAPEPDVLESVLDAQQKFWRLAGVLVLIGAVMVALGIVAAVAIPALSR
jgi:uncharacterized membrane protein